MSANRLGTSRKRNMRTLKGEFRQHMRTASALKGTLRGIEKRSAGLTSVIGDVRTVIAEASAYVHVRVTNDAAHAARNEKAMQQTTAALTTFTAKVSQLMVILKREDDTTRHAESEMRRARSSVTAFMSDTMRVVNEVAREVTAIRPDVTDDLNDSVTNGTNVDSDVNVISSLFRLHTHTHSTNPASIFGTKRGGRGRGIRAPMQRKSAPAKRGRKGASVKREVKSEPQ